MKTIGIIPVKRFARGKSRLASLLDDCERAELARTLFCHVLSVALESGVLDEVLVVTDGADVEALATAHGARVLRDPPASHLGDVRLGHVVDAAIDHVARSADAVLILMGDLPQLEVSDVRATLTLLEGADLVLAPDLRGEGTNALAMRTSMRTRTPTPTAFGHADSFVRHRLLHARSRIAVVRSVGLGFDVDTELDWQRLAGELRAEGGMVLAG